MNKESDLAVKVFAAEALVFIALAFVIWCFVRKDYCVGVVWLYINLPMAIYGAVMAAPSNAHADAEGDYPGFIASITILRFAFVGVGWIIKRLTKGKFSVFQISRVCWILFAIAFVSVGLFQRYQERWHSGEQTLDNRLTVYTPGPMTEEGVKPDTNAEEDALRVWIYRKDDIFFVVTETHYKASAMERTHDAKTNILVEGSLMMKNFPQESVERTDIQDKGCYKMFSFQGGYEGVRPDVYPYLHR